VILRTLIAGEETSATGTNPIGTDTLTLVGGNIVHPTTGTLDFIGSGTAEFGVTNASFIHATDGGRIEMSAPDNVILTDSFTGATVNVVGVA
jgi:hypothetical protein